VTVQHSMHCVPPSADPYDPAAHNVHVVPPTVDPYVPASHTLHGDVLPSPTAKDPAAQKTHAADVSAPITDVYDPAPHATHARDAEAPIAVEYVPLLHKLHWVLQADGPYEPAGHNTQAADDVSAPSLTENAPAGHAMYSIDAEAPTVVAYVPTAHRLQRVLPDNDAG
jgi:hypothetical protein